MQHLKTMSNRLGPRGMVRPYLRFFTAQTYSALAAESRDDGTRFFLDQSILLDLSPAADLRVPSGVRVV